MDYLVNEMKINQPEAWEYFNYSQCYIPTVGGPLAHTIQDYRSVLEKGLQGLIDEMKASMAQADITNPDGMKTLNCVNQYKAMIMVAEAMIDYAPVSYTHLRRLGMKGKNDMGIFKIFGYGLGSMSNNFIMGVFQSFLLIFYTDVFGIPAMAVSVIFLISKIWDAVNLSLIHI